MGRRRTRDFDLPPRLYRRGDSYYYVAHTGRWIPLGKDRERAKRKWADYECLGIGVTVAELVWRFLDDGLKAVAASTRKQYKSFARTIEREWGNLPADHLTRVHIVQYRDRPGVGTVWANGVISLLRVAYRWGGERDASLPQPADQVAFNRTEARARYLEDAEFRAIRAAGPRWMRTAMDVAYLTGLRPGDVLRLRWDMVGERLAADVQKTKIRIAFELPAALLAVLDEARQRPIVGLYVVANDKGRPISLRRWQDVFRGACRELNIEDATPRDIRGKAGTDAEAEGLDYQALLGHASRRTSDIYLKRKRTLKAPTLRRIIG